MSTRSILAFDTEKGIKGVYIHSDGYPEGEWGRLNQFKVLKERDGISKLASVVLGASHWAYLFSDTTADKRVWFEEELIVGYGAVFAPKSRDKYFTPDQLAEWWDSEYVYLVNPEGDIRYASIGVGHDDLTWDSLQWVTP